MLHADGSVGTSRLPHNYNSFSGITAIWCMCRQLLE